MNVANHLVRAGLARGERPAVARGGTVLLNYSQLADNAARIAGALRNTFGLEPGDRVGLAMKNCAAFLWRSSRTEMQKLLNFVIPFRLKN